MIWPHQPQFPHRIGLLVLGCAIAAGGAFLWPGLAAGDRFRMLVVAFYGVASGFFTYGILLMLLRFVRPLHKFVAFLLFYGALANIAVFLGELAVSAASGGPAYPREQVIWFAALITGSLGIAAAAFGAINRPTRPRKDDLEQTRDVA
jgi:hypothetical protein